MRPSGKAYRMVLARPLPWQTMVLAPIVALGGTLFAMRYLGLHTGPDTESVFTVLVLALVLLPRRIGASDRLAEILHRVGGLVAVMGLLLVGLTLMAFASHAVGVVVDVHLRRSLPGGIFLGAATCLFSLTGSVAVGANRHPRAWGAR
jgi:hypothetical protein